MMQYIWLARTRPMRHLLVAWCVCYAGDLAAFTAASVYAYRAGGAGLVAVLGLLKALPGAILVPLLTSWADRVRRERLLIASVLPRAAGSSRSALFCSWTSGRSRRRRRRRRGLQQLKLDSPAT